MVEYSLEEVNEFFRSNPEFVKYLNEFKAKMKQWDCSIDWLKELCKGKLAGSAFNFMDFTISKWSIDNSTVNIGLYNREDGLVYETNIQLPFFKALLINGMVFDINDSTKGLIHDLEKYIDEILEGGKI